MRISAIVVPLLLPLLLAACGDPEPPANALRRGEWRVISELIRVTDKNGTEMMPLGSRGSYVCITANHVTRPPVEMLTAMTNPINCNYVGITMAAGRLEAETRCRQARGSGERYDRTVSQGTFTATALDVSLRGHTNDSGEELESEGIVSARHERDTCSGASLP